MGGGTPGAHQLPGNVLGVVSRPYCSSNPATPPQMLFMAEYDWFEEYTGDKRKIGKDGNLNPQYDMGLARS